MNTLTVVQSLVMLSIRHARGLEDFRESIAGRITSLAKTHNLLVEGQWMSVSLRSVIESELEAHDIGGRIAISGPDVLLPAQTAVAFGMAVHELITNAVKHGALSDPAGHVDMHWATTPQAAGDHFTLDWTERDGPPVNAPKTIGFGSVLLERVLSQQLGGKITTDFQPTGLHASIEAFLPGAASDV